MSESRIAPDQQDPLKGIVRPAFFEKPEQSFDCDIHDVVGRFFACCAMDHMRDTLHCCVHNLAIRNGAFHDLKAIVRFRYAVVTQGANCQVLVS